MLASKNNYFKSILSIIAIIFLFLTVGAQFLHNHSDSDFHNDCPACKWLLNSVVTFSVILIFLGLFLSLEVFLLYIPQVFITKSYRVFQYLRSPPILTSV